jgi:cytochrome o ubiquinol oxidase operon protein cyoD
VLVGSIWVMFHLDHNMMPGMAPAAPGAAVQQMHDMP